MAEKDTTEQPENPSNEEHEVNFKYVKSNFFRVIHADGAWGGLSPRGDIHISFYNERVAIPDSSSFVVSEEGIKQPETFQGSGLVREVEADVIIDLPTAQSLRVWLDDKIKTLESLVVEAQEKHQAKDTNDKKIRIQG
ncbi:MAG: hypothetical protein ACR2HX_19700 [Pyrinomonadaceae bacterium]